MQYWFDSEVFYWSRHTVGVPVHQCRTGLTLMGFAGVHTPSALQYISATLLEVFGDVFLRLSNSHAVYYLLPEEWAQVSLAVMVFTGRASLICQCIR